MRSYVYADSMNNRQPRRWPFLVLMISLLLVACQPVSWSAAPSYADALPSPARESASSFTWRSITLPSSSHMAAMKVASPDAPVAVLVHGSDGFGIQSAKVADIWVAAGWTVVVPCWFDVATPFPGIAFPCAGAPAFAGQTAGAVQDLDNLIAGIKAWPEVSGRKMAVVGFSRGAGLVALRSELHARTEPIILISGLLSQPLPNWQLPGELFPLAFVHQLSASSIHVVANTDDTTVSSSQSTRFASAAYATGKRVTSVTFTAGEHGGAWDGPHAASVASAARSWVVTA